MVTINQFVDHPNYDAFLSGYRPVLDSWSRAHNIHIKYEQQVAAGSPSTALSIAKYQITQHPAIMLALGTPSAQATAGIRPGMPVVFGAITDPVAAGLVNSNETPGGNITGTSDVGPYREQFAFIKRLLPSAHRVGIIRNPGEPNSVASMKLIDQAISQYAFEKIEVSVSSTAEVPLAARSLVGRCEILYMPADNTVLSSLPAVATVADAKHIPLFVGDEGSVRLGAVATIGVDYKELGRATGTITTRILDGTPAGKIPVGLTSKTRVVLNPIAAKKQGVTIPSDVLASAEIVGAR